MAKLKSCGILNLYIMKTMKTGGMSNPNKKVSASKKATGKVGGVSKAPKTAIPKAKYGMVMRRK